MFSSKPSQLPADPVQKSDCRSIRGAAFARQDHQYRMLCPQCGYDLTPFPSGRCSECGFGYDHEIIRTMARGYFHDCVWTLQRSITLSLCAVFWWPFAWGWRFARFAFIAMVIALLIVQYLERRKIGKWIGDPWWVSPLVVVTLVLTPFARFLPSVGTVTGLVLAIAALNYLRSSTPPFANVPDALGDHHRRAIRLWLFFAWMAAALNVVAAIITFA